MKSLKYILDTDPKEIEFVPFRLALEIQKKNGEALYQSIWEKKKTEDGLILLSHEDELRLHHCNKALRWIDKKLKELDGEEI